ncbi:MAG: zinc-binding dehydrogenase [Flavobacteriales bacterium]|jgi:NADPH2:quinone reductase|nr:zinc-binding dehydrogenase [Flavobacteriales bacterium]
MKAAVLTKHGEAHQAFEIRTVDKPTLAQDEVLIKVEAFGLNFADVMARQGLYKEAPALPSILGYDVVGVIEEVANETNSHLIGKRVVSMTRFGGYAEYAKTKAAGVAEISNNLPAGEALALATQYSTAYFMAYECVSVFEGDNVLMHAAAGGVGTALAQLLTLRGCTIFGLTSSDEKFEYLKSNGVHHPINHTTTNYESEIRKILGGNKLDVAFNSVGGSTFKKDARLLQKGGRSVLYGVAERSGKGKGMLPTLDLAWKFGIYSPIQMLLHSQAIIGVNMLHIADEKPQVIKRCLDAVVKLTEEGTLKPYVGGTFKYENIGDAHALLESRKSKGKIIVEW